MRKIYAQSAEDPNATQIDRISKIVEYLVFEQKYMELMEAGKTLEAI